MAKNLFKTLVGLSYEEYGIPSRIQSFLAVFGSENYKTKNKEANRILLSHIQKVTELSEEDCLELREDLKLIIELKTLHGGSYESTIENFSYGKDDEDKYMDNMENIIACLKQTKWDKKTKSWLY